MLGRLRWNPPDDSILDGDVYPEDEPPFDMFPSVTEIVATTFCPRAGYRLLIQALNPFTERGFPAKIGQLYHMCIAWLKRYISGSSAISLSSLDEILTGIAGTNTRYIRRDVKKWWRTHRAFVEKGDIYFFEMYVSGEIRFSHGNCFVRGKIDEIDITNKKIVERTTKPIDLALRQRKDFQLWLLWRILSSIPPDKRPAELKNEDFEDYELVLETPNDKQTVKPRRDYEQMLYSTLRGWIRPIKKGGVWMSIKRTIRCDPAEAKEKACGLRWICFQRNYRYPEGRIRLRTTLTHRWRALLWETIWLQDLQEYRLILRNYQELAQNGTLALGSVERIKETPTELEVEVDFGNDLLASGIEAEAKRTPLCAIVYGTPSMGIRLSVDVRDRKDSRITLIVREDPSIPHPPLPYLPNQIFITSAPVAMYSPPPVFLYKRAQHDSFIFTTRGTDKERIAERRANVQLLEGFFGRRRLVRE